MRNAENHNEIRGRIRAARRGVAEETRERWSAAICERVAETNWFLETNKIAGFLAFDGEADPIGLMTAAFDAGKQVYVPIILGKSKPLKFAPWSPTVGLKPNRFDILEPNVSESEWIEARDLELVITPLVAFDDSCHRIGVGGGYYDRSFGFLIDDVFEATQVSLVGFAFELQKVELIKGSKWDVPLAAVATETLLYTPRR
jgi:5-formyltetrahydrofolate cyclo-ligase